jgi:hypothetical protein
MRSTEELSGTLVLIRSAELHNKIGTISSALLDGDTVMVAVKDDLTMSFSAHELFVLRNPEDIEKSAKIDQTLLPFWNYADIMEAAMFARSRYTVQRIVAIELSAKDPDVFEYTMDSLAHELGLTRSSQISR